MIDFLGTAALVVWGMVGGILVAFILVALAVAR